MRFALLGDHPDGVQLARALVESGRHQLAASTTDLGPTAARVERVSDPEEILADPQIEAVIVAVPFDRRPEQLRRALQSERTVLCVYPPDQKPDIAYEASMIQADTKCLLFPILPEALHPGIERLASFVRREPGGSTSAVGDFLLLVIELHATGAALGNLALGGKPSFPGWFLLCRLGGEIAEVSAFASEEDVTPGDPVLVAGRFADGGLFQVTLLPRQPDAEERLTVVGERGRAELSFPHGRSGPAFLSWQSPDGERQEEFWEPYSPWDAIVAQFEEALQGPTPRRLAPVALPRSSPRSDAITPRLSSSEAIALAPKTAEEAATHHVPSPGWQDCIRALELDDAARRSIERRRAYPIEYPEANEEVGFKGTMVLAGCSLLWGSLFLLILAAWLPSVRWFILPLLTIFLLLQLLRYLIPRKPD